eukprot:gene5621-5859_t
MSGGKGSKNSSIGYKLHETVQHNFTRQPLQYPTTAAEDPNRQPQEQQQQRLPHRPFMGQAGPSGSSPVLPNQQQNDNSSPASTDPLPEAAPATKTDPLEVSLLASYLEVVRKTQGEAAAADAMAASGLPPAAASAGLHGLRAAAAAAAAGALQQQHDVSALFSVVSDERTHGKQSLPGSSSLHFNSDLDTCSSINNNAQMVLPDSAGPRPSGFGDDSATVAAAAAVAAGAPVEENLALDSLLGFIKNRKLAGLPQQQQQPRRQASSSSLASSAGGSLNGVPTGGSGSTGQLSSSAAQIWIQPSGPRRPGEGVENEEQGILSAEEDKAILLGFPAVSMCFKLACPSGASVREVVRLTGADINSWTEQASNLRGRRPARIFLIKGEARCVAQAIYVVTAAVDRYKELCEGRYCGQSVPRAQNVLGVTFSYQPPPKSIVPCAASLKELYAPPNTVANRAEYVP